MSHTASDDRRLLPEAAREDCLLGAAQVAELLNVSRSQFFAMQADGRIPYPTRLSPRCPRWPLRELRAWIAEGCPPREAWRQQQELTKGRRGWGTDS
jgi:predicted DNA-binding transcriptional regulator AlpA